MLSTDSPNSLILASASSIRTAMLRDAGVAHTVVSAAIDEDDFKTSHLEPHDLVHVLAQAKALAVSHHHSESWVIGSDSTVTCDGRHFSKPRNRDEATSHLRFFSGKKLVLTSAAALARKGKCDWAHVDSATLRLRTLSEEFIAAYLDADWPEVSYCVGVFRIEGPGIQLFDTIAGSHFTILGMPLLPLLSALRERKIIPA